MTAAAAVDPARRPRRALLPLVRLLVDDERLAAQLRNEAGRRGMRVTTTNTEALDAVVCTNDAADAVTAHPDVPVLVLGPAADVRARHAAVSAGAAGFLDRETPAAETMDQVVVTLERARSEVAARVLLVGEKDPATAAALSEGGFEVVALADPDALIGELERVHPALVVVDGGEAGRDVCRLLRHDRHWSVLPILAVTSDDDPETVERLHAAGADDLLLRPVSPVRVRAHFERFRFHQALAEVDRLTGLARRVHATELLGRLIRMAQRLGRPLCLATLDLDEFAAFNLTHGRIAGDGALRAFGALLRRSFRGEDVVARWTGDGFVIGLFGAERDVAVDRFRALLEEARLQGITFSAGVAEYPTDGADLEALYHAADDALYVAKTQGRERVHGASQASTQLVDVALVDGADIEAEHVTYVLGEHGHRCWRFSNGASAVSMLTGAQPLVRAGVILLELDLMAVDGFELLTILGRDGVLDRTQAIVVTATDTAESRARARELGARDYIVKPVRAEQLARRVDEALGRRGR